MFLLINLLIRPICDIPRFFPHISFGFDTSRYLYPYFTHLPFFLELIRCWLLFYDYNHSLQLISNQWTSLLLMNNNNNNGSNKNEHWTIKYKKYLSNKSNVLYYICVLWVILSEIVSLISSGYSWTLSTILYTIFSVIIVIFGIIIAFKVRPCRDHFFIRDEFKLLSIPAILIMILFITTTIIFDEKNIIRVTIFYVGLTIAITTESYISTKWIINKYELQQQQLANMNTNNSENITLLQLLSNQDGFDLFAEYLVKEFSIENLLFLFETMYLKLECLKNGLIKHENIGIMINFDRNTMNLQQRRESAVTDIDSFYFNLLYIKNRYIDHYGEYSINISSLTRSHFNLSMETIKDKYKKQEISPNIINRIKLRLTKSNNNNSIINNKRISSKTRVSDEESVDIDELDLNITKNNCPTPQQLDDNILKFIGLIDDAINEIIQLMASDSFVRFCQTDNFKQLYPNLIQKYHY